MIKDFQEGQCKKEYQAKCMSTTEQLTKCIDRDEGTTLYWITQLKIHKLKERNDSIIVPRHVLRCNQAKYMLPAL